MRLGLAFADLCLYNWRRPARVPGPSPFAAAAVAQQPSSPGGEDPFSLPAGGGIGTAGAARGSIANPLPLPASVLRLGPHTLAAASAAPGAPLSGEATRLASAHASSLLDEQHRLITLLEYARDTHATGDMGPDGAGAESGDSATGDDDSLLSSAAAAGLVLRRQVARWAGHLLDVFYGEDADELDGDGDGAGSLAGFAFAQSGLSPAASGPPAVSGGHFVFGAAGGSGAVPFGGAAVPSAFAAPTAAPGWGPPIVSAAASTPTVAAGAAAPVAGPVRGQVMLPAWMTRAQQAAQAGPGTAP